MSNVIICAILLGLTLSLLKSASAKICTKEGLVRYEILRLNSTTNRLIPIIETRLAKIQVCCEGYQNVGTPRDLKCEQLQSATVKPSTTGIPSDSQITEDPEPICDPPCGPNGNCYYTNRCACDRGYKFSDDGCVPGAHPIFTTSPFDVISGLQPEESGSCINGDRNAIFCICPQGYHLKQGNCLPICSKPCVNSQCTAPERCGCDEGHQYDTNALQCKPTCNGKTDDLNGCIAREPLQWMWHLLWIPAAGIAIIISYFLIRRFASSAMHRINGENEVYFFSDNNPSTTGNHKQTKDTDRNGYVKGELTPDADFISKDRSVVIINT